MRQLIENVVTGVVGSLIAAFLWDHRKHWILKSLLNGLASLGVRLCFAVIYAPIWLMLWICIICGLIVIRISGAGADVVVSRLGRDDVHVGLGDMREIFLRERTTMPRRTARRRHLLRVSGFFLRAALRLGSRLGLRRRT